MIEIPKKHLREVTIEGLTARILQIPSEKKKSKKNFFLVYGQHTSHERMYGISQYLSRYGNVYAIDIPGYGGMDSFYSIGKEPTIEAYGHYIYTVMKLLKLEKNVWIIGNSMGFLYVTRMLQLHPQVQGSVDQVLSLVGFTGKNDFAIKQPMKLALHSLAFLAKSRPGVFIAENLFLNPISMKIMLNSFALIKNRMRSATHEQKEIFEMETHLWKINDQRTHAQNAWDMFHTWDLTQYEQLPFDVINLTAEDDQYFDPEKISAGMDKVFKSHKTLFLDIDAHSPSIIGTPEDFEKAIPKEIRKLIEK